MSKRMSKRADRAGHRSCSECGDVSVPALQRSMLAVTEAAAEDVSVAGEAGPRYTEGSSARRDLEAAIEQMRRDRSDAERWLSTIAEDIGQIQADLASAVARRDAQEAKCAALSEGIWAMRMALRSEEL